LLCQEQVLQSLALACCFIAIQARQSQQQWCHLRQEAACHRFCAYQVLDVKLLPLLLLVMVCW
jgi:hypothetical protein